jgi:O-antigen/teichoic acid export membrane protein
MRQGLAPSSSSEPPADNTAENGVIVEDAPVRQTGRRVLVNTGALTSASLYRIAMSFVLQLLIARRLGVEGLGHYTIAMAYLNVSQVISELGLPALLVRDLAQMPSRRRSYFRALLGIQIAMGLLTWGALVLISLLLPYGDTTRTALWLVGASLPLFAVTSASQTLFQAGERMELVMGVEVFINTLILLLSVLVLWRGGDEAGLIAVIIVTQLVSALICVYLVVRSRLLGGAQEAVRVHVGTLLRQAMPFFGLSLGDVLLQRIDILLLSIVAGPAVTGIYSAAYNLVRVLMKLVQSFWKALYPTLSRLHHQSQAQYERLARLGLRYGLLLLLPTATIGAVVAGGALHLIFGGDYDESARVFQILLWAAPLFLLENYATTLLMVERHLASSLLVLGLHLAVTAVALPLLTPPLGADGAAWAVVLAGAVGAAVGVWQLVRLRVPLQVKGFWRMALGALAAGGGALLLPLPWPAQAAAGGLIYLLFCWATGVLSASDLATLRATFGNKTPT